MSGQQQIAFPLLAIYRMTTAPFAEMIAIVRENQARTYSRTASNITGEFLFDLLCDTRMMILKVKTFLFSMTMMLHSLHKKPFSFISILVIQRISHVCVTAPSVVDSYIGDALYIDALAINRFSHSGDLYIAKTSRALNTATGIFISSRNS
jgi:hypothetical protein